VTIVLFVVTLGGCGRTETLLSSLPSSVGDRSFDMVTVVDESFRSGHPVDDVLAALGKRRPDAAAVFRDASEGWGTAGAMTVSGVDGPTLLEAVVTNWDSAGVVDRSQRDVGAKPVWLLTSRLGHLVAVYAKSDVVYIATSFDAQTLDAIVRGLARRTWEPIGHPKP
jgi:hypothetical protein